MSNYFMGLNVNSEQPPQAATPAPQFGYWSPSPNTSQTQVTLNLNLFLRRFSALHYRA